MTHSFLVTIEDGVHDDERAPLNGIERIADRILDVASEAARDLGNTVMDAEIRYLGSN